MKKKVKILSILSFISLAVLYLFTPWVFERLVYYLYYYFAMMGHMGLRLFDAGVIGYGLFAFILQIFAWLLFIVIFYISIFNALFPRIRVVDALKNGIRYARKVKIDSGPDPRFVYMKIKFKFFPIFRWHTFKAPKPEYTHKFLSETQIKVENGNKGVTWKRMPNSLDIVTETINIEWLPNEEAYQLTPDNLERLPDYVKPYREKSIDTLKRLSQNVNESVRGDSMLLKDQYQTGIPISIEAAPTLVDRPITEKKELEILKEDFSSQDLEELAETEEAIPPEDSQSEEPQVEPKVLASEKIEETKWKMFKWD